MATFGSTSAIASIAARIPLPMAVRRPVVRLRIASTSACWSLGRRLDHGREPAERHQPDLGARALARRRTATAASSAASRRVGSMSVEHMLPDTSIARMIVAWLAGTLSTTTGRPSATTSAATAGREQRRTGGGGAGARLRGIAAADQRQARVARGRRPPTPLAPEVDGDQQRDDEQRGRAGRPQERHGSRPAHASDRMPPTTSSISPRAANSAVTSSGSLRTTSRRLQVPVDGVDAVLVVGAVIRAAGHLRDLHERRLVELGVDAEAVEVEVGARRRAHPDGHDPDPAVGRLLGRLGSGRGARCSRRR